MNIDGEMLRQLIATFSTEAQDLCAGITHHMLDLERLPPGDPTAASVVEDVARSLHTLKGSAATVGLTDISKIAHALEDLVAPLKAEPTYVPQTTDCFSNASMSFRSDFELMSRARPTLSRTRMSW